jgi:hypothetical protein
LYEAFGNHDCYSSTFVTAGMKARNPYRTALSNISSNGYHYSWDADDFHFVCLNLFPGNSPDNIGGSPEGSLPFLISDLDTKVGSSGRPVVLYHHFGFDDFSTNWWSEAQRDRYYEVLKNYNVAAIFCAHNHLIGHVPWRGINTFNDGTVAKWTGNFIVAHFSGGTLTVIERTSNNTWGNSYAVPFEISPLPVITSAPAPVTAPLGASVALRVRAVGPSLSYQWFFNGSNLLPSQTNSVLRFSNLAFLDSGLYQVQVNNPNGTVTSPPAALTVVAPLEMSVAPVLNVTGADNQSVNLEFTSVLDFFPAWNPLTTFTLSNGSAAFVDSSAVDQPQRFYRLNPPAGVLAAALAPAMTVFADVGQSLNLQYSTPLETNWYLLATLTLTNSPQMYIDLSAIGQPLRIYRAVSAP